jgi:hypothetical protein
MAFVLNQSLDAMVENLRAIHTICLPKKDGDWCDLIMNAQHALNILMMLSPDYFEFSRVFSLVGDMVVARLPVVPMPSNATCPNGTTSTCYL